MDAGRTTESHESPATPEVVGDGQNRRVPRADSLGPNRHKVSVRFGRFAARIINAMTEGFALCAYAMHPEHFCRADEAFRPSADELADEALRSRRSAGDSEPLKVIPLPRVDRR